ncbi:MAG: glycoside hydrolase family 9 protein [Cytophagaceae bacterium]|jgi:endoglucanase|nr:glycoside hydrolase family 9 protein [Cytophagaceae bacterium]
MKNPLHTIFYPIIFVLMHVCGYAQVSSAIRLNQVGFYPNCSKLAVITGNPGAGPFYIRSTNQSITYFTGTLGASATWPYSGETVRVADFSAFTTPGTYVLTVPGIGYSYTFDIAYKIFTPAARAGLKTFYYQRGSSALLPAHAGVYARAAGHPDNAVIVLPSAASAARPAGTVLSSPRGWYDAGDYNSYIVNSGITTYTLMAAYEHFRPYFDTLNMVIPESGGVMPDILDEIKWNLDWMLTMQDPNDGGVYNKKTCANFSGFIMPAADNAPRYMCAKGTAATFDFAAVMAVAYRIYRPYNLAFANQCLAAAQYAWNWGVANPAIGFANPAANGAYPAVNTGEYGDWAFGDEREWAANELYIATGNNAYYANGFNNANYYGIPSWPDVRTLGLISLVFHRKNLTNAAFGDTTNMKNKILALANPLQAHQNAASAYRVAMGQGGVGDFNWGSNMISTNQGMLLLTAFEITQNAAYCNAALANLDYLLGRNATNYSFVTGFGDNTPMNIHHRVSFANGVVNPIPGFMIGGPQNVINPDGCNYTVNTPAGRFLDDVCSYSTNEIAINWNAPFVYLAAGIEYLMPCNPITLPVNFVTVAAIQQGEKNKITWTTQQEVGVQVFLVQRSWDGINFETIGKVPAQGRSEQVQHYAWDDFYSPIGKIYYRIVEQNLDNREFASPIFALQAPSNLISIYPNPSKGNFTVERSYAQKEVLEIFNGIGEKVYEIILSENETRTNIDLSQAPKGYYVLRCTQADARVEMRRMVLE